MRRRVRDDSGTDSPRTRLFGGANRDGSVAVTGGVVAALHVGLAAAAYPTVAALVVLLGVAGFLGGVGLAAAYDTARSERRTVCVPGIGRCVEV